MFVCEQRELDWSGQGDEFYVEGEIGSKLKNQAEGRFTPPRKNHCFLYVKFKPERIRCDNKENIHKRTPTQFRNLSKTNQLKENFQLTALLTCSLSVQRRAF